MFLYKPLIYGCCMDVGMCASEPALSVRTASRAQLLLGNAEEFAV